jgi:protein phosphatase
MGSRAVVVVCRDETTARERFGVDGGGIGAVYTRTGRPFFPESGLETGLLQRVQQALERAGFWDEFDSSWFCMDAELLPWSAKAQELLRVQYAAVGSASRHAILDAVAALQTASERHDAAKELLYRYRGRASAAEAFVRAYRRYCWPVRDVDELKLAPFHLLASEGKVHTDRDHVWHMAQFARIAAEDSGLLLATAYKEVEVTRPESEEEGVQWWLDLTGKGGEGMVVKPLNWLVSGKRGLVQPAVKCRGREYLRLIYGLDYTAPENLERLRARGLSVKRSLALRELALGLEALQRFVEREPLYRVHECVFAVLALESEPVDPRL